MAAKLLHELRQITEGPDNWSRYRKHYKSFETISIYGEFKEISFISNSNLH